MAVFNCKDKGLEYSLKQIQEILMEHGGFVHDELIIREHDGQLSIETPDEIEPTSPIITVPEKLLLPLEEFTLGLTGDELVITSFEPGATSVRRELLGLMIDIYNRSNKIAWHRRVTPWIYYQDDPLFYRHLAGGRGPRGGFRFPEKFFPDDRDGLLVYTFLKTRRFVARLGHDREDVMVLMPLIDLVNHHPISIPFVNHDEEDGSISLCIYKSCPIRNTNECFARYGYLDAHDIFLDYNYVENDVYFVRCVPFTIELPGVGTLEVSSTSGIPRKEELPEGLQDLHAYFPTVRFDHDNRVIYSSHLLIPQATAPQSLRRIIAAMIKALAPDIPFPAFKESVTLVEKRAIENTMAYYQEMQLYLQQHQSKPGQELVHDMALQVAGIQLANIRKYPLLEEVEQGAGS